MHFNDGCGQVLYIGHSSEKIVNNFYAEVQIEQIKIMQSLIGLAGLIFEIIGKN